MLFLFTRHPDRRDVCQHFDDTSQADAEAEGRRLAARHGVPYVIVRARDAFDQTPKLVTTLYPGQVTK